MSSWLISIIGKYLPLKIGIPVLRITDDLNTKPNSKRSIYLEFWLRFITSFSRILFTGLFIISKLFSINYFICLFFLFACFAWIFFDIYKNKYSFIVIMNSISYIFFLFSITLTGLILYEEVIIELD